MVGYLIKEAFRTINRNRGEFLLSSAVQAICLLLLSLFIIITINLFLLLRTANQKAEVFAFVTDEVANSPLPLQEKIANIAGVAQVRFVSKEEAFEEIHTDLGSDTTLLSVVGENPIPASIRITLQPGYATVENVQLLEEKLLLLPGVVEVWSGKELLGQLNRALKTTLILDILILAIVALSVLFVVFQTTENSIISRAQEIEIMELVGASRIIVRAPFLLQGTIQGLLGGITAFALIFIIYRIVITFVPAPLFPIWLVLSFTLGLGALFGLTGALLGLNRLPSTLESVPMKIPRHTRIRTGIG